MTDPLPSASTSLHCLVLLLHFYFTVLRIRLDPQNISILQSVTGYNFPLPLTNTFKFRDWKDISDVNAKSKPCWNECQGYAVIKLFLFFRNCRLPVCLSSNNVRNVFMIFYNSLLCNSLNLTPKNIYAIISLIIMKELSTHPPRKRRKIFLEMLMLHYSFWPMVSYSIYYSLCRI